MPNMSIIKRGLFWAIMGVLMVPLDALHVVTGVLSYRSPELFGVQAFWVLPLFACAGLALGMGHRHSAVPLATRFFAATVRPTTTWAALGGLGALLLAYASSGALQGTPIIALFGYVALWSIVVWRVDADARPALILHSLGAAIVGPLVEMAISSTGAFTHAHNDIFGVPLWLPGIYLNAAAGSILSWSERAADHCPFRSLLRLSTAATTSPRHCGRMSAPALADPARPR